MSFVRIYADAGGQSQFEDLDVSLQAEDFVSPASPDHATIAASR
jgi:hypothetical protein